MQIISEHCLGRHNITRRHYSKMYISQHHGAQSVSPLVWYIGTNYQQSQLPTSIPGPYHDTLQFTLKL